MIKNTRDFIKIMCNSLCGFCNIYIIISPVPFQGKLYTKELVHNYNLINCYYYCICIFYKIRDKAYTYLSFSWIVNCEKQNEIDSLCMEINYDIIIFY